MIRLIPLALVAALSLGCGGGKSSGTGAAKSGGDGHDGHDHDRDKMKLVDAGPYHAGLTAHLSKDGNELEILFETVDKDPTPVGLTLTKFTGTAKKAGEDKVYDLTFEPAPKDERKGDKDGECSHFEAKAPWMKPDDVLTVTVNNIEITNKSRKLEWKDFNPKKYNHVEEGK